MAERARIDFPSRIGVWWASDTWPMQAAQEVASEIEALGYGSLFLPEVGLKDCMVESAAFLQATDLLVVGTGIANIHARVAGTMEGGARTLNALYPGRFVLGRWGHWLVATESRRWAPPPSKGWPGLRARLSGEVRRRRDGRRQTTR